MNELAWAMLAVAIVTIPLFSYLLTRRYSDPTQSSKLTSLCTTTSLALSLLTLFLVPVDIYTVSANLNGDGTQKDPAATESAGDAVKILYYVLYSTLLAFAFFIMPFVYFYFEEDDDEVPLSTRVCGALKYTIAFVVIFAVLLALGIILKSGKFDSDDAQDKPWIDNLKGSFGAGDSIMVFCVASLATLGLFGWLGYTSYGMAAFPIDLMRFHDTTPYVESRTGSDPEGELQLAKTQAELKFLTTRYEVSARKLSGDRDMTARMSADDKKQYQKLKREEIRLLSALNRRGEPSSSITRPGARSTRPSAGSKASAAEGGGNRVSLWWSKMWNATAPLRIVVGLLVLGVSFLIVLSYVLSAIDKAMHSSCKASCGYALDSPTLINPIDKMLTALAPVFPLDYIAFGGITLYIFLCSVYGLVAQGVRLLCWKLYEIERKKTMPHGLIMGSWLLMFVVLLLNMELLTLAPQYTSFGNQFYINHGSDDKSACSTNKMAESNGTVCVMTQVATFVNSVSLSVPFFGVIFYYANYLFLATFLVCVLYSVLRKQPRTEYQQMQDVEDDF